MLKIKDLEKLKITSIKNVIHFKYENEHYFIHTNYESTTNTSLYKGRSKYKNECIKSTWGFIKDLIKYEHNKKVLSAIDKRNFVKKLYKAKLIELEIEDIKTEVENEREEYIKIQNEIAKLNDRLCELNN